MKTQIVAFALVLLFVSAGFAQMPMSGDQKSMPMPDCAAMMQQEKSMQQHMADMNTKLEALVDAMNKAKGSARIDKMQAVINELVAQRSMMMKEMMKEMSKPKTVTLGGIKRDSEGQLTGASATTH